MSKRDSVVILILVILAAAGLFYGWMKRPPSSPPQEIQASPSPEPSIPLTAVAPSESPIPPASAASPAPKASAVAIAPARKQNFDEAWKNFQKRFGSGLRAEFGPDGKVSSIQGAPRKNSFAEPGFESTDSARVLARAREILGEAAPALGVSDTAALGDPAIRTGATSAQAGFHQSIDGVPLAPYGDITVVLGSQGEILRVDSSYVSPLRITGEFRLSAEQAMNTAIKELGSQAARTAPGNRIVWVSRPSSTSGEPVEGRPAYDVMVDGRQVVVDAASGGILFQRDRRIR